MGSKLNTLQNAHQRLSASTVRFKKHIVTQIKKLCVYVTALRQLLIGFCSPSPKSTRSSLLLPLQLIQFLLESPSKRILFLQFSRIVIVNRPHISNSTWVDNILINLNSLVYISLLNRYHVQVTHKPFQIHRLTDKILIYYKAFNYFFYSQHNFN